MSLFILYTLPFKEHKCTSKYDEHIYSTKQSCRCKYDQPFTSLNKNSNSSLSHSDNVVLNKFTQHYQNDEIYSIINV
jgi:hypothetical protein